MISRNEWGEINLENAREDFNNIFDIADYLKILPIEFLPDNIAQALYSSLQKVIALFNKIDQFSIANTANPSQVRDSYVNEVRTINNELTGAIAHWIPYLAYKQGDVEENINKLRAALSEAETYVDNTKENIQNRVSEIEDIVSKAREAAAAAGAAVFTCDFQNTAKQLEKNSQHWLIATGAMALITLFIAYLMWQWTESGLDQGQLFQKLGTKLVILLLLVSATAWCGRIYKALKHLATIYHHRALSIQTLQAFSAAASDEHTKNAVLLEATRAVFGNMPTGYVEGSSAETDLKIIEVFRRALTKVEK